MRRTVTTDDSQAVSLFPFLAVLLSTMGALLVVLVVMARQARLQAAQGDRPHAAPVSARDAHAEDASARAAEVDLQQLQAAATRLQAVRDAGLEELEKSRLRLRHADHHLRQLQDEVAGLYQQLRALEERDSHRVDDREQADRELARLRELIRDTEKRLDEERQRVADVPKSYAIVPYKGPHGTTRRPLYIECRRDAVVLQPEGIELDVRDFQGPLGPGNPLASALRAADEYYAAQHAADSPGGAEVQPYPLVLVRPDGIAAYYYVRRALEGWSSDFGYELLDGDWKIDFPFPNPQVANLQQRAINLARARQKALALAAPRRFGGTGGRNASQDGSEGGSFGGFDSGLPDRMEGRARDGWGSTGQEQGGPATERYAASSTERAAAGQAPPSAEATDGSFAGKSGGGSAGQEVAGEHARSQDAAYAGTSEKAVRAANTRGHFHSAATGGTHGRYAQRSDEAPTTVPGQQGHPGGSAEGDTQSPSPTSGARAPDQRTANPQPGNSVGGSVSTEPLAEIRGSDWAVPQARLGAVPVRRTIHVVVRKDRLAVLPEHGAAGGRAVPVTDSVQAAIDPFIEAVQERVTGWGTAGRGLYWQPILVLQPGPDGVHNAEVLRQLLNGSGLEIAP